MLLSALHNDQATGEVLLNEENINPKLKPSGEDCDISNLWYLDNWASNHMTGDKTKFCDINKSIQGFVKFEDGSKVRIEGIGSIKF